MIFLTFTARVASTATWHLAAHCDVALAGLPGHHVWFWAPFTFALLTRPLQNKCPAKKDSKRENLGPERVRDWLKVTQPGQGEPGTRTWGSRRSSVPVRRLPHSPGDTVLWDHWRGPQPSAGGRGSLTGHPGTSWNVPDPIRLVQWEGQAPGPQQIPSTEAPGARRGPTAR